MTSPISRPTSSPTRTDDLVEIQQLLAKYAVTITQGDIDGLISVFTPDGTYSAFGSTYTLARLPELVDAAPKGLFMTGTSLVTLDCGEDQIGYVVPEDDEPEIGVTVTVNAPPARVLRYDKETGLLVR